MTGEYENLAQISACPSAPRQYQQKSDEKRRKFVTYQSPAA